MKMHLSFLLAFLASVALAFAQAPAKSKPTGLTAGAAKGTLTVNGKTVNLAHAYAALEEDPLDEE